MKLILQLFRSKIPEKDVLAATSGVFLIKNYRKPAEAELIAFETKRKVEKGGGADSSDMMHTFCTSKSYHNKSSLNPRKQREKRALETVEKSKSIERLINYLSC